MAQTIFFASDLHLGPTEIPEEAARLDRFLDFLDYVKAEGQYLVLLGDLFDFWFEYRAVIPKAPFPLLAKLYELREAGVALSFVPGNHDHWLLDFFPKQLGARVFPHPTVVTLNGLRVYLAHGDGLLPRPGPGSRFIQGLLHHPLAISLYRLLPPDLGIPLGHRVSAWSRARSVRGFPPEEDLLMPAALRLLQEDVADLVIFGHSHLPHLYRTREKAYLNIGDWLTHQSFGRLVEQDVELLSWPLTSQGS